MDSSLYANEEMTKIYDRQFHTVYRVCLSFMKNAEDAEDMAQETFLKLLSCEKRFESEEHEKAWLIVTASNTCKDELRKWKRRLENIRAHFQQETVVRKENDRVLEWVMALPVKYKQVIYLHYYEGYRTSEIAGMLHCPESTVRNQLLRGRKLLQKNNAHPARSSVLLAAVLAGSLFVTTTVYAAYFHRLRDLHLGKEAAIISLGGIAGSPEYLACSEWRDFLEKYDTDGAILSEIGNDFAGLPEEYELVYNCYTREMADKVDELCEKFGLSRLKGFYLTGNYYDLCRRANVGNICKNADVKAKWDIYDSYLYEDGTFHMEGRVAWENSLPYVTDFQLVRTMKGSFNPITLNIGKIEEYSEWNYSTGNAQNILLANSSTKALIIAERENSFIVVNVLGDFSSDTFEVSDKMLEELAALFDFSVIP